MVAMDLGSVTYTYTTAAILAHGGQVQPCKLCSEPAAAKKLSHMHMQTASDDSQCRSNLLEQGYVTSAIRRTDKTKRAIPGLWPNKLHRQGHCQ
jgi:hypothetical protein